MSFLIDFLRPVSFRGKARVFHRLVPQSGTVCATVNGYNMRLELHDYCQRMIYMGAYERLETSIVKSILRQGSTFVDVGANVGYFSLLASSIVGAEGHVLAFEPSPYVADRLMETIDTNSISNIDLCRCGLGNENSEGVLSDPHRSNHTPTFLSPGTGSPVAIRVLDEVLSEKNIEHVDLMKIDVEGFELKVLSGAEKSLSSGKIRNVLIEFNAHWLSKAGTSSRELHERLVGAGFVCAESAGPPEGALSNRLYSRR